MEARKLLAADADRRHGGHGEVETTGSGSWFSCNLVPAPVKQMKARALSRKYAANVEADAHNGAIPALHGFSKGSSDTIAPKNNPARPDNVHAHQRGLRSPLGSLRNAAHASRYAVNTWAVARFPDFEPADQEALPVSCRHLNDAV